MSKKISQSQIDLLRKKYFSDNHVKVVRNAMVKTNSNELSMDWEKYRKIDHTFSNVISGEMPATNQKSSGRCWGFAGLNLFRVYLGRKHNLKDFQFSQSYFMKRILIVESLCTYFKLLQRMVDNGICGKT